MEEVFGQNRNLWWINTHSFTSILIDCGSQPSSSIFVWATNCKLSSGASWKCQIMEELIIVYFITKQGGKSGKVCFVTLHKIHSPLQLLQSFPVMFHWQKEDRNEDCIFNFLQNWLIMPLTRTFSCKGFMGV